jgi:hypothetical protein
LDKEAINRLAHRFFVWGTQKRLEYGAAPVIQFNESQSTDIRVPTWLVDDVHLIEKSVGVGFFYYGPRMWMVGEVEPLKQLRDKSTRVTVINRILKEYPSTLFPEDQIFYRLRTNPLAPSDPQSYDSPPASLAGSGRLDSPRFPVMYGSQDLEVCIHECRVTANDEVFVGTLAPKKVLKLLDLTEVLQEDVTEFESLDMAVHMLFLAGGHAYEITREIALAAHASGFDGLIYPSYFSLLRTGNMPFETAYGLSLRIFKSQIDNERTKAIPNLALFGRPISLTVS